MPTNLLRRAFTRPIRSYLHWLHVDDIPAGTVETLPEVREGGRTNLPGVRVVGDLTGIPLLKFSADSGARAVRAICAEEDFARRRGADPEALDVAIIGAGVSGMAAAIEAKNCGLSFAVFEAARPFATIVDFPKGKPIYAYPKEMTPAGAMQFRAEVKEDLVDELERCRSDHGIEVTEGRVDRVERVGNEIAVRHADGTTTRALRVIVAIGRSGNFRKLGVPGEEMNKVYNRLHDPKDYCGKNVLVVGGGDSALEAAVALVVCGAHVTLSYRKTEFSRPKPDNVEMLNLLVQDPEARIGVAQPVSERVTTAAGHALRGENPPGSLALRLGTEVQKITDDAVNLVDGNGAEEMIENDAVFTMVGREPPLDFFRRSGIVVRGEWTKRTSGAFVGFLLFCAALYSWKALTWDPFNLAAWMTDQTSLVGTLVRSMQDPGFYYTLSYCVLVAVFGVRRVRRRKTPYVKAQTASLAAVQIIPLFILPYIVLPWMGANGLFESGIGGWIGGTFFPNGSYWRAFGFVLAWPLFVYNVFTAEPLWGWLVLSLVQTFVIIPLIVYRWGKGAYCGWICSCGALAETLGDAHRYKMPHGSKWNRLNYVGQFILWIALFLLALRVLGWLWPDSWAGTSFLALSEGEDAALPWKFLSYKWVVDLFLAGVIGLGSYFWFSGRVWCRFACPLAALMHVYARLGRFRIFADKKKCISCNVCTAACHQGIDVMNFANKGRPTDDPECVRCSACVHECPTGTLTFGRLGRNDLPIYDSLPASPVQMREGK